MTTEPRFRNATDEPAPSPTAQLVCPICGQPITRIEHWIGNVLGWVDLCVNHHVYARSNA